MDVRMESRRFAESADRCRKCYLNDSDSCFEANTGCGMGDTDAIVSWYCRGYGHGAIGTHGSLQHGGIGYGNGRGRMK